LLFWTGEDSDIKSGMEWWRVGFMVLADEVIGYTFPFVSLDCIILLDVVTEFSLKPFHVVRFCYFKFKDVLVDDAFVGFYIWEGV
jgi:hypothetical protein